MAEVTLGHARRETPQDKPQTTPPHHKLMITTPSTYTDIPEGQCFGFIPTMAESLMGGFSRIDQLPCGVIRVHYTDGTREERDGSGIHDLPSMDRDSVSLFSILSWVQEGRK
jgi:hypothetical protein